MTALNARTRVARAARGLLRLTAAAALVGSALWGGASHWPATLALAGAGALALAAALIAAWADGERLELPAVAIPLLVMALLAALQLVPIPPGARAALMPESDRITRIALAGLEAPGHFRPIAVDAPATLQDLTRLLGLVGLLVAFARLAGDDGRSWLRQSMAIMLAALLAIAALSFLRLAPAFLHLARTRSPIAFPLANPNHAAALIAALLPTVMVLATRREGLTRAALIGIVAGGTVALVATLSRAGIAAGLVAEVATLWLIARHRRMRQQRRLFVVLGIAAAAVLALGLAAIIHRFRQGSSTTLETSLRLQAAREALGLFRDSPWLGIGRGSFGGAFARYSSVAGHLRFAYVENEYLQALIDFGVIGGLAIAAAVVVAARRSFHRFRDASLGSRAAALGLGALALHNAVDFSWETGAVAASACALAALAFPRSTRRLHPFAALGLLGATLLGLGLASRPSFRLVDQDIAALRRTAPGARGALEQEAFRRHPTESYLADLAAERLLAASDPRSFEWIDRALLVGPRDVFAHSITARGLMRSGHREQAALELYIAFSEGSGPERAALCALALELFPRDEDTELLLTAVPPRADELRSMADYLARARRFRPALQVARAGLLLAPDDPRLLRLAVSAAVEGNAPAGVAAEAQRLAAADPSPEGALLAARGLAAAGDPSAAALLLEAALARAEAVEVAIQLATLYAARGETPRAVELLERSIARAIRVPVKVRLHSIIATYEDQLGNENRATAERAEAARLARP